MRLVLICLCFPVCATADGFALLDGDVPLPRNEVIALTSNQSLTFFEGGVSQYSVGGAYSYSYVGGGTAFGRFEVGPEGVVCVDFRNGRQRCDQFVRSHRRIVMITQDGQRFPIKP